MAQGRGVAHCDEAHAIWGPAREAPGHPEATSQVGSMLMQSTSFKAIG